MTGPKVRNRRKQSGWKGFFILCFTMSTKTPVYPMPASISNQMETNGYVQIPTTLMGEGKPFDCRLMAITAEDDHLVMTITISWRQRLSDNMLMPFNSTVKEEKNLTWGFGKIFSKFRMPKALWDESTLAKFKELELYHATLGKGEKEPNRDCPWMIAVGDEPMVFLLEGRIAKNINLGSFTEFQGKVFGSGNSLPTQEWAPLQVAAKPVTFTFAEVASAPAVPPTGVTAEAIAFPARK